VPVVLAKCNKINKFNKSPDFRPGFLYLKENIMSAPSGLPPKQDFSADATIVDASVANTVYTCTAVPGALSTDPVWSISKAFTSGGVTTTTWANGNSRASNIAANRLTLTYS
jgi:hypothetical protein